MTNSKIIKTRVSQANWCNNEGNFENVSFCDSDTNKESHIYWLDELFMGGIHIPEDQGKTRRPLFFLISGPPGSGKSTLALEICYRASMENKSSFYITTESDAYKLKSKGESYGWEDANIKFLPCDNIHSLKDSEEGKVYLWGTKDKIVSVFNFFGFKEKNAAKIIRNCINIAQILAPLFGTQSKLGINIISFVSKILFREKTPPKLNFLVIDSLNTVPYEKREVLFSKIEKQIKHGPEIVMLILDSGRSVEEHSYWEHICDIVLRMDYNCKEISDYYVRNLEIIKARYQSHVWGKHQLKIYGKSDIEDQFIDTYKSKNSDKKAIIEDYEAKGKNWQKLLINEKIKNSNSELYSEYIKKKRRAHPYCNEGGIFIFPSIHYFLSKYKRRSPTSALGKVSTHIKRLDVLLGNDNKEYGGLPKGRCTAIVGSRGSHKSHLAYYQILKTLYDSKLKRYESCDKALIISLRDDEGMARVTLNNILTSIMERNPNQNLGNCNSDQLLDEFVEKGYLEILYFPPGYITPEEFYHRVLMSLLRLKNVSQKAKNVTVLFNSLDQLFARFPLCAQENVFIPGLIDTFSAEGATSIFIGVDEPSQPKHQYGLLTMADLIVTTNQLMVKNEDLFDQLALSWGVSKDCFNEIRNNYSQEIPVVSLWIQRFAGGQRAGHGGILELNNNKELSPIFQIVKNHINKEHVNFSDLAAGLIFTPMALKNGLE